MTTRQNYDERIFSTEIGIEQQNFAPLSFLSP